MEQLADHGNGNYAYIDSIREARKVLVVEAGSTLVTIAKDVKIQLEFNPHKVAAYRLIGYENRLLEDEDFKDDEKDAGELGAGHSVTALYEVIPAGGDHQARDVDLPKYQTSRRPAEAAPSEELLTVKLRYKLPSGAKSREIQATLTATDGRAPSHALGFATAVAEFGMLLRDSEHKGTATYSQAAELARRFLGKDSEGYRAELVDLIDTAAKLTPRGRRRPVNHPARPSDMPRQGSRSCM